MRYLPISIICLLMACYSPKYTGSFDGLNKLVEFSRGACFGKCPIFNLTIYEDGVARYKGTQNVKNKGEFYALLPKEDFKKVKNALKESKLSQYEDRYQAGATDLPTVKLISSVDGQQKTITGDGNFPQPVLDLHLMLDSLIARQEWMVIN